MPSIYVVPQSEVFVEFNNMVSVLKDNTKALIVGPHFQTVRYDDASEKPLGLLGDYDPDTQVCQAWPNLSAGAVVDLDAVAVYIDAAMLRYAAIVPAGDTIKATFCDGSVELYNQTAAVKNIIRASSTVWVTANGVDRDAIFYQRDVRVGDVVEVSAAVGPTTYVLVTKVAGFAADVVPGVVEPAQEDPNNVDAGIEGSSEVSESPAWAATKVGYGTVDVDISDFSTPGNQPQFAYLDGVQADTYTMTVITAGAPGTAAVRVASASGTDDVANLPITAFGVAQAFGSKGLSVTFAGTDDFALGMQWLVDVVFGAAVVTPESGGSYSGPSDTAYVIRVSRGGKFSETDKPQITVSTTTGIDVSGPHDVTGLDTAVAIGSYGVTITFRSDDVTDAGLYLNDRYYIPVLAATAGAAKAMILANNMPDALLGLSGGVCGTPPDLSVTLYIQKNIEVTRERTGFAPVVNWQASADDICLNSGILAYDASWVDGSGAMLPLDVRSGSAYVQYRALKTQFSDRIYDYKGGALPGPAVAENPLGLGVSMAWTNSNNSTVRYIAVESDDADGYTKALNIASSTLDAYTVIALSHDVDVRAAVVEHVNTISASSGGRWRTTIVSKPMVDDVGVLAKNGSGGTLMATITDNPSDISAANTLVEFQGSVSLSGAGVKVGDIVRANYSTDGFGNQTYDEYRVAELLSDDSLVLTSGPDLPVTVAAKVEIWRVRTTESVAAEIIADARDYNSRRVCNLWPDYIEVGEQTLPGYYLAAAIAGLRSGVVAHRPLRKVAIAGIDGVSRTRKFSEAQLEAIAAAGNYIVAETDAGEIYTKAANTTDITSYAMRDEVVTRNLDSILYEYLDAVAPFVGITPINAQIIARVENVMQTATDVILNQGTTPALGPQVEELAIESVLPDASLQDRLVATITAVLPTTMNSVELDVSGTVTLKVVI